MATLSRRKRINIEGNDYNGPKRQRIVLNKDLREKVLQAILMAHIRVVKELGVATLADLNLSEQITAALLNAHNCLRQTLNGRGGLSSKVSKTTFIIDDGMENKVIKEITKDRMESILTSCLKVSNLTYTAQAEWIGIASPMFAFIIGFKARRQELRIGTSDIPTSKTRAGDSTVLQTIPITEYGLTQAHSVLLEGITYPPNLKSMMAQSLGPMTSLIMLSRSGNGIYSNKWEEAVIRDFMNIPDITQCASLIKTNPASQSRPLFRTLADILLITGSRSANRMFFPAFCLTQVLLHPSTIKSVYDATETNGTLSTITITPTVPSWKDDLSFSGQRGFEIYQQLCDVEWTINVPQDCRDVGMVKQIFFHAVFGTYKEDLGILRWMTEGEPVFYNRKNLSPAFGKSEKKMVFRPYRLKRWSKLVSAQQTDFLGTSSSQLVAQSTFSGKRVRNWGDDFFKHLDSDALTGAFTVTRNIHGMVGQYTALLTRLRNQLEKRGRNSLVGTVKWYRFTKDQDENYEEETEVPIETNSFFIDNKE